MRWFETARARAREVREIVGREPGGLMERVVAYLKKQHKVSLMAVPGDSLEGSDAEVSPLDRCIYYDERLDNHPEDKLFVICHELGHLEVHERLKKPHAAPDLLADSIYTSVDGAPAVARYSSKSDEEEEANAFAKEFLCPGVELFSEWLSDSTANSAALAARRGVWRDLVRVQLAEYLYDMLTAGEPAEGEGKKRAQRNDPVQEMAARHVGSPAIVNAGPGTGKTSTLVMRIAYLMGVLGVPARDILVLTFSYEACGEIRRRVAEMFGAAADEIVINTFHGFGYSLLLSHGLDLPHDVWIADEAVQNEIVTSVLGGAHCDRILGGGKYLRDPSLAAREAVRQINHLKERVVGHDRTIDPVVLNEAVSDWKNGDAEWSPEAHATASEFVNIFNAYEAEKVSRHAVDFGDLISEPARLLRDNHHIRDFIRAQHKWVLVDEYQDAGRSVAALLKVVCGPDNPPWVVCDVRQSIYVFRGASPENVRRFAEDFPGAEEFDLGINYRSGDGVIEGANQLATLLESPDNGAADYRAYWTRGAEHGPPVGVAVSVARAANDAAELEGVADQVEAWIGQGVAPSDIAVLARRNIDVRGAVLALSKRGIRASTSGLITPEGAAGDLAAVLTLPDHPKASIPRVVYALGRGVPGIGPHLDAAVAWLLEEYESRDGEDKRENPVPSARIAPLVAEFRRLEECLAGENFSGDAFSVMCAFLFDGSSYLRRALAAADGAERALTLSEVVTSLTRAAGYRFSHLKIAPLTSRLGFAHHFRNNLSSAAPVAAAPVTAPGSVAVMTCHASKGLEFPYVMVVGQTLSKSRAVWWIPPSLRPTKEEDHAQANAVLFVGLTRARRAVVVSYSPKKSALPNSTPREVVPLLKRWVELFGLTECEWNGRDQGEGAAGMALSRIWGGKANDGRLSGRSLAGRYCAVQTYIEQLIGIKFPPGLQSIYPRFFNAVRAAMGKVVVEAHACGARLGAAEAGELFAREFKEDRFGEHPHTALYARIGATFVARFAEAYEPFPHAAEFFDSDSAVVEAGESLLPIRLDLVAHYVDTDGREHAILYRPESLASPGPDGQYPEELNWSAIPDKGRRASFVLLSDRKERLQPWVYSAADGRLYKYRWNKQGKRLEAERLEAGERHRLFTAGRFEAEIDDWVCDPCPSRVTCPLWMKRSSH
ncbi:MAG TPA: UvrD-helicase domain-containing protein [Pyrinomonadaceae bacterium]